jgi:hypothetical protein
VHALAVVIEELGGDPYFVAGVEFTDVGDVGFKGEERGVPLSDILGPKADGVEGFIAAAVEKDIIVSHVEMAVVVNPLVLDLVGSAFKRSRIPHHKSSILC